MPASFYEEIITKITQNIPIQQIHIPSFFSTFCKIIAKVKIYSYQTVAASRLHPRCTNAFNYLEPTLDR